MTDKPTYESLKHRIHQLERTLSEHKRLTDKLSKGTRHQESIIPKIQAAVVVHDAHTRIVSSNLKAHELLGLPRDKLVGKQANDPDWRFLKLDGETLPVDQYPVNQVLTTRKPIKDFNVCIQRPGSLGPVFVVVSADPVFDDRGEIVQVIVTFMDISKHKQAEDELKAERFKLKAYFENLPLLAYNITRNGIIADCNQVAVHALGFHSKEELIGRPLIPTVYAPASREKANELFKRWKDKKRVSNEELQIINRQGEIIDVLLNVATIFNYSGYPQHSLSTHMVITDRKEMEMAVRESEQRLRSILRTAMDGFWLLDIQGRLLDVNETYCRMSGYSEKELLSMCIADLEAAKTPHEVATHIQKVMDQGEDRFESRHRRKDGSTFNVEISVQHRAFDGGRMVTFIRDITQRKKLETRIRLTQRVESLGLLAGGIAHDFNNILSPIIGMSELLMEDLPKDSFDHENAREIYIAGNRARDLVKQILAFSRRSEHVMIPVRIHEIVKEALKLIGATISANIEITEGIEKDCGPVRADPTQLHQVIMNLMTNAYQAVEPTGGKIVVDLREKVLNRTDLAGSSIEAGTYAMLTISDTGCGIDPNVLDKIIEPYFTTKGKDKGTGLGLAVAYGIVKEHNGDFKIYSEKGKGTTVKVFLPSIPRSPETDRMEKAQIHPTGHEHILLVDDEEAIVRLSRKILERLGYRLTWRTSSIDALEAFRANPKAYDLVITDMTMPKMNGDQLVKELFTIRADIPVIICTGFSERINHEKATAAGINGFLMKPIVKSEMAEMVRRVLDAAKESIQK